MNVAFMLSSPWRVAGRAPSTAANWRGSGAWRPVRRLGHAAAAPGRRRDQLARVRVAPVAAGVLLAHVGDRGVRMRRLDLERGDQRVLGLDRLLVRFL